MTYEEYMSEKAFGATYTRGCKDSGVARSTKRVSGILSWGLDGGGVLELCFICFDSNYGRRGDVKTGETGGTSAMSRLSLQSSRLLDLPGGKHL
jgi:hypothetical protein